MSFTPNGTIRLLAGVPLDNTYTHTVRYADRAAQTAAFMAKGKAEWTFEHCTYIREHRSIKVPICADDVIMCNYLMYQNLNYGLDKWFYAFITKVIYINDHNTEIEFEIDVMQTWMYDFAFRPCYIERQHTTTDVIGDNVIPEPIETGEFIIKEMGSIDSNFMKWSIIAYTTFDWNSWTINPTGTLDYGNVYSALTRTEIGRIQLTKSGTVTSSSFIIDPNAKIKDLIDNHANLVDGVVAIVLAPYQFEMQNTISIEGISKPNNNSTLIGYTPKNKKLFTFQFYRMFMTDGNGSGKWYAFEDFGNIGTGGAIRFTCATDSTPNQTIVCAPRAYKGVGNNELNYEESISMTGLPQCAWVSDAFKTYLAMSQGNLTLSLATSAASVVGGVGMTALTGGAGAAVGAGMATSGISGIISTLTGLTDKAKTPPKMQGGISGSALFAIGEKGFKPICYTMKPEFAKIADDFLSMYGYAIHNIGVPNPNARPYWTYIKTQNALIVPDGINGLPSTDMKLIEAIHDKGITYWKTMDNVGNYTLNNAPV